MEPFVLNIQGKLTAGGEPVQSAQVDILLTDWDAYGATVARRATTDSDGGFAVDVASAALPGQAPLRLPPGLFARATSATGSTALSKGVMLVDAVAAGGALFVMDGGAAFNAGLDVVASGAAQRVKAESTSVDTGEFATWPTALTFADSISAIGVGAVP